MRFALQAGLMLKYGQKTLELVRELDGNEFQFEDVRTRRAFCISKEDLIESIYSKKYTVILGDQPESTDTKNWPAVVDLSSLRPHERKNLDLRLDYVKHLLRLKISKGQRNKIAIAVKKLSEQRGDVPPSTSAVMMWMRNFEKSSNNPLALVDKHRFRGGEVRKLEAVERIIWEVLKKNYFTKSLNSIRFAHDQLKIALNRAIKNDEVAPGDAVVSYQTLCRRIQGVDLYFRYASREGVNRARHECRVAFPGGVASYPYQRIEIDHTPLNWVVICDRTGLPLGRPTLTVMIDAYSGYILGIYLSFHGPGLTSVCGVVRNALMPKGNIIKNLALENYWLSSGLGDEWVIDNGLEFHSFGFRTMAMALGVDLMYCRVRTPWLKPHVERFFSTLNTLTLMKGRVWKTTPNILRIDPYKDAAIGFSDLVKGLLMFVVDVYPFQPNWRKMATPFELFQEGIAKLPPAEFPGSLDQLRLISGMSSMLTLTQGGIESHGLPYGSYSFKDLAKKYGTGIKLLCKWDPDNILEMKVQDPDGVNWYDAECRWKNYADGLSFNQHKLIRKYAKARLQSEDRLEKLLAARTQLHEHWRDATRGKTRADSLTAGRYADMTSHKVFSQNNAPPTAAASTHSKLILPSASFLEKDIPEFDSISF